MERAAAGLAGAAGADEWFCDRGCGREYHATYGGEKLCIPCRQSDARGARGPVVDVHILRERVERVRKQLNDAINEYNAAMMDPVRVRAAWNRIMDATNDLTRALQRRA